MKNQLTQEEYKLIAHSLGVRLDYDKELPKSFHRNFFGTAEKTDNYKKFLKLVDKGFATMRMQFGEPVFHITEKGIELFTEIFNIKK